MVLVARSRSARRMLAARFDGVRELRAGERFTVFVARRRGSSDDAGSVAIKVPTEHSSPWATHVLLREAETLAAVGAHPGIVALQELLTLPDGRPALVFEHHPNSLAELSHATNAFGGDRLPLADVLAAG